MANPQKRNLNIARSLLVLMVFYFGYIGIFQHSHVINGVTVIHSHVHSQTHQNTESGGHSCSEITLISQLSNFQTADTLPVFQTQSVDVPIEIFPVETSIAFQSHALKHLFFRGPPIL